MSILDAMKRGWWSGWAEFPELAAGGAGLLESLIPGDTEDDPLERLQDLANFKAEKIRSWGGGGESSGILEHIAEGLSAAPGQVSALAPFLVGASAAIPSAAAGAAIATPALAFGAHGLVRHGDEGLPTAIGHGLRGAAEGAAFGQIGKLAGGIGGKLAPELRDTLAMQLKRKAAHVGGVGGLIGGVTAAHGGTLEESIASGTTMGLLGMITSGKYKEPIRTTEKELDIIDPLARAHDLNRVLEPEGLFKPEQAESSLIEGLGSYKDAAARAKPPGSPLQVPWERRQWDNLTDAQREVELKSWKDAGGEYDPYSYASIEKAIETGNLSPEGNKTMRVSPLDVAKATRNKNLLDTEITNTKSRLRRAEAADNKIDIDRYQEYLDGLMIESTVIGETARATKSVAGAATRAIGLFQRGSPEWRQAVKNWKKKNGDAVSERVLELAELSEGNPELLARIGRAIDTPKLFDYFQEYWINGLLSGPPTQMVNTGSNALRGGVDVVEKTAALKMEQRAGIIDKKQMHREISADLHAGFNSLWPATKAFVSMVMKEDFDVGSIKPEYRQHMRRSKQDYNTKTIPGTAGKIARFPGRTLQAMDIAFKIIAGDRYAASESYRMAYELLQKKEITPAQFEAKAAEFMGVGAEVHPRVLKAMKDAAERLTFTEPLSPVGMGALKLRDTEVAGFRPGVMVLPFVSTPWNVIKQAVARSPLGLLRMKSLKSKYDKGEITPHEYYREVAATGMGTAITVGLVGLAKAGFVTGGGPANQQDRMNLLATGWRPYSIKVGDAYIQAQRLEPLGTILGMAGDIAEYGDSDDKFGKMIAAVKNNVTDKSFLYGLESLSKAFSNPEMFGPTYYKQMTGSLVPTIFSKAAQAVDPNMRQVEPGGADLGIPDALAYRIPGMSQELPLRTTAFGEPAERWGVASTDTPLMKGISAAQSMVSAIPTSFEREGVEVEKEFDRLRNYPGMPPSAPRRSKTVTLRGVNGESVKLTEGEYQLYDKYNQMAKQHVATMINSTRWASVPDAMKAKMMRKTYDKYRRVANQLINQSIRKRTSVGD